MTYDEIIKRGFWAEAWARTNDDITPGEIKELAARHLGDPKSHKSFFLGYHLARIVAMFER